MPGIGVDLGRGMDCDDKGLADEVHMNLEGLVGFNFRRPPYLHVLWRSH